MPRDDYGATLIEVGARQSPFAGTAAAMAESPSSLEHRIRVMVAAPTRLARRAAPVVAALSLCVAAMAARVEPPQPAHLAIELPPATLRSHAGYYQLDPHRVVVVMPAGQYLSATINTGRSLRLTPESDNSFFVAGQPIEVRFDAGGLTVRQYGIDYRAPRVGPEAMEEADAFVTQRFADQLPYPGSEAILRRNLELAATGHLQLDDFSPEYGKLAQRLVSKFQLGMQADGAIKAIRFAGVNSAGWDMYRVQYEHGLSTWHLWLVNGKVSDAFCRKQS